MISDCSSRLSSVWRSERIPIVTLSKSISSAALGAWAGGSLWTGRGRCACCWDVMECSGRREAGLAYLPGTVIMFFVAGASAQLIERVGARFLIAGRLALIAA